MRVVCDRLDGPGNEKERARQSGSHRRIRRVSRRAAGRRQGGPLLRAAAVRRRRRLLRVGAATGQVRVRQELREAARAGQQVRLGDARQSDSRQRALQPRREQHTDPGG